MLKPFWKKHFTLQHFFPFYENPTAFITCQWQKNKDQPNLKYLTYRTTVALLFLVTWLITLTKQPNSEKWPIFLTNWGYTLCTIQALLAVFMLSFSSVAPQVKTMPNLKQNVLKVYPAYWILSTIATPIAFGITFMYWTVVYNATMTFDAMNYFVHGNNSVLMMLDLWIVNHPLRIFHFIYPSIIGIIYAIFSVIYYASGGTSRGGSRCIYEVLDWDKPLRTTLICLGVILLIVCLHMIAYGIHRLRQYLHDKYCLPKEDIPLKPDSKEHAVYDNKAMSTDIV